MAWKWATRLSLRSEVALDEAEYKVAAQDMLVRQLAHEMRNKYSPAIATSSAIPVADHIRLELYLFLS